MLAMGFDAMSVTRGWARGGEGSSEMPQLYFNKTCELCGIYDDDPDIMSIRHKEKYRKFGCIIVCMLDAGFNARFITRAWGWGRGEEGNSEMPQLYFNSHAD